MSLSSMKSSISIAVTLGLALLCASCRGSRQTNFYSKFSVRELVERNQTAAGFKCDGPAGGGGGGNERIFSSPGGIGPGRTQFNAHKSDSLSCALKSEENLMSSDSLLL
jgi:hypothetical protein